MRIVQFLDEAIASQPSKVSPTPACEGLKMLFSHWRWIIEQLGREANGEFAIVSITLNVSPGAFFIFLNYCLVPNKSTGRKQSHETSN